MNKKVFVSGCFDTFHSGHVAFLKSAAEFGDLHVSIGSDKTVYGLKGRSPNFNEDERTYILNELSCVKEAFVGSGSGMLDFKEDLLRIKPDVFVVNKDGDSEDKKKLIESLGIEYLILDRIPHRNLPARSSTRIKEHSNDIPYRIDLAGGWLDQPYVSKHFSGPVITISLEPTYEFNLRSGMASSTRNKAIRLWGNRLPQGDNEELAKILFSYDNPPGTKEVAGSQDSLGIVMPGLNYLSYDGDFWPKEIKSVKEDGILDWLESVIHLVPLNPRGFEYDVLGDSRINKENVMRLAEATENCWKAILSKDIMEFGKSFKDSFESQVNLFPRMVDDSIMDKINEYKDKAIGWKLSGAGGGGYLILISDKEIEGSLRIKIRRNEI